MSHQHSSGDGSAEQVIEMMRKVAEQVGAEQVGESVSPVTIAFLVAVATILVFVLYNVLGSFGGTSRTAVICGPCNSGKTVLFHQLAGKKLPQGTVASMQPNVSSCTVLGPKGKPTGGAPVKIVDVPGHERLRGKLHSQLKEARAVVFVLDAVDITPHRVETAEELFEVLTHPDVSRRRLPVVLACNKMDLETQAHSVEFIERTLQKQLDAMRKTRTALSPEAAAKAAVLGKIDKPLTLATLRNPVTVTSISAQEGDLDELHSFLASVMR